MEFLTKLNNPLGRKLRQLNFRIALSQPDRLRIVTLLDTEGEMYLGDIFMNLRIGQRIGKRHIAALKRAGIVKDADARRLALNSAMRDELKFFISKS